MLALGRNRYHAYTGLDADYDHRTVDHAVQYVDGQVHTNYIENFWALLKRGLHGTYISVEPFHLFRYLDERVFTFNLRCSPRGCVLSRARSLRLRALPASLPRNDHRTPATSGVPPIPPR